MQFRVLINFYVHKQALVYNNQNSMTFMQQFQKSQYQFHPTKLERQMSVKEGPFVFISKKSTRYCSYGKSGEWSLRENAKYAAFIKKYVSIIQGKQHSKLWMIYVKMAKFIKTRNFRQCKQHHQKLCSKFYNVNEILRGFQRQFPQFQFVLNEQMQFLNDYDSSLPQNQRINIVPFAMQNSKLNNQNLMSQKLYLTSDQYLMQKSGKTMISHRLLNQNVKEQWMECHKLFLQWTSKLNYLMLDQSRF